MRRVDTRYKLLRAHVLKSPGFRLAFEDVLDVRIAMLDFFLFFFLEVSLTPRVRFASSTLREISCVFLFPLLKNLGLELCSGHIDRRQYFQHFLSFQTWWHCMGRGQGCCVNPRSASDRSDDSSREREPCGYNFPQSETVSAPFASVWAQQVSSGFFLPRFPSSEKLWRHICDTLRSCLGRLWYAAIDVIDKLYSLASSSYLS